VPGQVPPGACDHLTPRHKALRHSPAFKVVPRLAGARYATPASLLAPHRRPLFHAEKGRELRSGSALRVLPLVADDVQPRESRPEVWLVLND